MTLRALEERSTQSRVWGPKLKWVSSVTPRILVVLFGGVTASPIRTWMWSRDWWVSDVNRVTLDFWGQWPVAYHQRTSPIWCRVGWPSPRPPQCWEQRPAEWSRRRRMSCLVRGLASLTQSGWRGLGRWRIPVGSPPALGGKTSGAAGIGTTPSCREGTPQAIWPDCCRVGSGGSSQWGGSGKRCRTPSRCPPQWIWFC